MNVEAGETAASSLTLATVEPDANPQPNGGQRFVNRRGTPNGSGGTVEGSEETVAGDVELASSEKAQLRANEGTLTFQ